MKRVVLHIDRLILKGIRRADVPGFTQRLQRELTHQLQKPGTAQVLGASANRYKVKAGNVRIAHRSGNKEMAAAIANRIIRRTLW